jgi:hypothetical protein
VYITGSHFLNNQATVASGLGVMDSNLTMTSSFIVGNGDEVKGERGWDGEL